MRITTSMIFDNATRYISLNTERYYRLQEQLLTQKRINRPSDDPVGNTKAMDLRELIAGFDQYERNILTAESFTDTTDVALANVVERLQRALELTVDINDPLSGPAEFANAATEMEDVFKEVLRNANLKLGDRFIFAGFATTTAPFDDTGAYVGGAAGQYIEVEVSRGDYMAINFTGDEVFKGPLDVMQLLQDTATDIASGDQSAISSRIPELNAALDQILTWVTTNGARENRVSIVKEDNTELHDSFVAILSDVEDIDITAVASEFAMQEQVLQANQLVSAKLLQQNFLDFFG